MKKILLLLLLFFAQFAKLEAQDKKNRRTYDFGKYQIDISLDKQWDPMSQRKKEALSKEMASQKLASDKQDVLPMTYFIFLEKGLISSFIGEYSFVDSVQKKQTIAEFDNFLKKKYDELKTQYPDVTIDTSQTNLEAGKISYRVFNFQIGIAKNFNIYIRYYHTFFEDTIVGFTVTTMDGNEQIEVMKSIKEATFGKKTTKGNNPATTILPKLDATEQSDITSNVDNAPRETLAYNNQILTFASHLPYTKVESTQTLKGKPAKKGSPYSEAVFNYEGVMGAFFKCNAHNFHKSDKAINALFFADQFEITFKEEQLAILESPPLLERHELVIGEREYYLEKVTFETNLLTVMSYIYYTKVGNIVYEFSFLAFDGETEKTLIDVMSSMIIAEPQSRKKKNQ